MRAFKSALPELGTWCSKTRRSPQPSLSRTLPGVIGNGSLLGAQTNSRRSAQAKDRGHQTRSVRSFCNAKADSEKAPTSRPVVEANRRDEPIIYPLALETSTPVRARRAGGKLCRIYQKSRKTRNYTCQINRVADNAHYLHFVHGSGKITFADNLAQKGFSAFMPRLFSELTKDASRWFSAWNDDFFGSFLAARGFFPRHTVFAAGDSFFHCHSCSSVRMILAVIFSCFAVADMGVNLGCSDSGMA